VYKLTQSEGEPLRLVVVNDGHTQRVEAHQTQHSPVEALGLHQVADSEAEPLLLPPEVRRVLVLVLALQAGPGERRPGGGSWSKTYKMQ